MLQGIGKTLLFMLFMAVAALHFSGRINLTTADLGRHIRNGEIALKEQKVISTNHYASTHTEFHTVCHHWGVGVLFYWIHERWGFVGLSVFYTALLTLTLGILILFAARFSSWGPALLAGFAMIPLIAYRTEIRPEGLTTLFMALVFIVLYAFREGKLGGRWLWTIPLIQLVWINVHILFFVGFGLLGIFAIDALIRDGWRSRTFKAMVVTGAASLMTSLVNPFGLEGLLEPLNIFKVYGYQLAENMTVFFMMKRFPGRGIYELFLYMLAFTAAVFALRVTLERKWRTYFLQFALIGFFGLMAVKAVRAISMFGYIAVPLIAINLHWLMGQIPGKFSLIGRRVVMFGAAGLIMLSALSPYFPFSPLRKLAPIVDNPAHRNSLFAVLFRPHYWGGLLPGINGSAEFFKLNGMMGPVFNNYDIGGFFIYHLFPRERPFVDNRPEAYPVEFFKEVYAPMQEDPAVWDREDAKHKFQAILFYRHDMTTWGQPFLVRMIDHPDWAPVFVDNYTLILARRGGINQAVIDKYELPREMFKVTKND